MRTESAEIDFDYFQMYSPQSRDHAQAEIVSCNLVLLVTVKGLSRSVVSRRSVILTSSTIYGTRTR